MSPAMSSTGRKAPSRRKIERLMDEARDMRSTYVLRSLPSAAFAAVGPLLRVIIGKLMASVASRPDIRTGSAAR